MIIRLNFIHETDKARLYEDKEHEEFWIPRSVVSSTTKFPNGVHELNIEDWWWNKHENETDEAEDDEINPNLI